MHTVFLQMQKSYINHKNWFLMQFILSNNTYNSLHLCDVNLLMSIQHNDNKEIRIIWKVVDELTQKIDDVMKLYWNLKKNQQNCMHIVIIILTELQNLCSFVQHKYFLFFFMLHIFPDSLTITLLQQRQQNWKRIDDESVKWWVIDKSATTKCRF